MIDYKGAVITAMRADSIPAAPVRRLREERRALRARVRELEAESAGLWANLQAAGGEP